MFLKAASTVLIGVGIFIAAILGILIIYGLGGFFIKSLKRFLIAWDKADDWIDCIDKQNDELRENIQSNTTDISHIECAIRRLERKIDLFNEKLEEIKESTGIKQKEEVSKAEQDFLGGSN